VTTANSTAFAVTLGNGKTKPQGHRVEVKDIAHLAKIIAEHNGDEAWWSMSIFRGDYRSGDRWISACGVAVDCDYYGAGAGHSVLPPEVRAKLEQVAWPGTLFHLTPRGCRVVFVTKEPITTREQHQQCAAGAAALVERTLASAGLLGHTVVQEDAA
jgi:hypothetical protein